MTNKKQPKQMTRAQSYAKRQKKGVQGPAQILGGVIGGIAGMSMGGPLGAGIGASLGSALGNGIGYITGSGDYKVQANACLVPGFKNSDSTVITHREYITDIKSGTLDGGSTAFNLNKFPLNPGDTSTFPWLASIAANYEEYDILGMVFAYVATSGESVASSNTALGSVILATEYDPTKPDFANKQAMENYSFATSAKPSVSQMHAVECAKIRTPVKQLYVRSGANTGTDLRWTDFGNFYIATVGCPATSATLGELWVTYKVRLVKPRLPITVGYGGQIASGILTRSGCTPAIPLGTATLLRKGPLVLERLSDTQVRFRATPNMDYLFQVHSYGFSIGTITATTFTGAVVKPLYKAETANNVNTGSPDTHILMQRITCTLTDTDEYIVATLTYSGAGSMDIVVSQIDETM